ncbi:FAA hydrolase family protein [Micromonospora zingiberis]|uniref:FAA hydrolase family protein n=1 Tax=Micromonospora zingiberis TaxID=2053011 RepID=A0A4R0GGV3_9ACTN|nr:fumarylacetoacetate hydrolase family protein [Micromonospora zingiberis]TCB95463.1 FAA hydrolase family protein [Micromonospora zingiberis]
MKFVSFRTDAGYRVGVLTAPDTVAEISLDDPERGVLGLIERSQPVVTTGATHAYDDLVLTAPIPRPARNIMCVGKNYREHAAEFAASGYDSGSSVTVPAFPIIFTKAPSAVADPGAVVTVPRAVTAEIDYEAEFAVIIGTGGKGISRSAAMDHVWGYTLINDLTARDLQRDHKQWFLGKSLDGFAPMGPLAVTRDEIDLAELVLTGTVNGSPRQSAPASDLIFDIPTLIETISAGITLQPGDIIATGTPAGVGIGFDPPRFLEDGDVVEVAATGLGSLTTTIAVV